MKTVSEIDGDKSNSIAQIMGELAYKKNQEKSIGFARKTTNALASLLIGLKNRGIHGANFAVLRGFNGPSVLIEVGFISNQEEIGEKLQVQHIKRKWLKR